MREVDDEGIAGNSRSRSGLLVLFVIGPVLLHMAGVGLYAFNAGAYRATWVDIVINATAVAYLAVVSLLLKLNPQAARRFGVGAWSLVLTVILVEMAIGLFVPSRPDRAPWLPVTQVTTAADTMPGISGRIVLTVNPDLGLRAPLEGFESADLRILCLGGSTTECLYVTDEQTWPRLLQNSLSRRLGLRVFVGNGGRSGHFTLHTIEKIKHYSALDRFDLILIMNGINDMGTLLFDDYETRATAVPDEALLRNPFQKRREGPYYSRSRLVSELDHATRLRGWEKQARDNSNAVVQDGAGEWYVHARKLRTETLRVSARDSMPEKTDAALNRYRANLREIIELCRAKGKPVVFITQPTIYAEELSKEHSALLIGGVNREFGFAYTERVLTRVMNAYNDVLLETCADQNIECIDLAALLPKDTSVFYDDCHFNTSGCQKVAAILADRLGEPIRP